MATRIGHDYEFPLETLRVPTSKSVSLFSNRITSKTNSIFIRQTVLNSFPSFSERRLHDFL